MVATFVPPERFHATTSVVLDGYDVVEVLGLVRGITVRSRSVFGRLGAGFQQIFGGEITLLTDLCEQTRARAFDIAVEHARALGGNALIALRYDATEIMSGVSEVLCYGTAARVVARTDGVAVGARDAVTREVTRAVGLTAPG
ncbi:MAG TPA: YbjQ family protein [Gemmatirosa sp.]